MRHMWTGTIGAGMVVFPVALGNAVSGRKSPVHEVRKEDGSPVGYRLYAKADGADMKRSEMGKGYELADGRTVVLSDEDFKSAYGESSRAAEVLLFTDPGAVPRTAAETSYWAEPGKGGEQAYALLAAAMKASGKVAVVRLMIRERENLALLYTDGDGYLLLERIAWHGDVKKPDFDAPQLNDSLSSKGLLPMAEQLITEMTGEFDWASYEDTGAARLAGIAMAKAETGQAFEAPAPLRSPGTVTSAGDLMATLAAAVAAEKAKRAPVSATRQKPVRKPRAPRTKTVAA